MNDAPNGHELSRTADAIDLCGIRTRNPAMLRVLDLVRRFAVLDTPVLIQGETGTGKELVARALHMLSSRRAQQVVTVDCAALPETLAESELFGHERGAFTGADRSYAGRIQVAAGGTLFLDEVNAISLHMQGKLLRFLEAGEFWRVGQQRPVPIDVRLVSASNVPLDELVAAARMRADFFYRLNILRIDLPPLRERLEDIPLLVRQFLDEDANARQHGVTDVSSGAIERLQELTWSGNVRELRNVLRQAVVLGSEHGVIRRVEPATLLPAASLATPRPRPAADPRGSFRAWMREREREYLADLVSHHRTVSQQAAASGLPQRTLYRKMRGHGLLRSFASEGGGSDASTYSRAV